MRYGSEVKVGLIVILGLVLLSVFVVYVRGLRPGAESYRVSVIFTNARGLQPGDPVRMAGVKIGEVDAVDISPDQRAVATLKLLRRYPVRSNDEFRIGTSGLIQERFVEVVPQGFSPEAKTLEGGEELRGVVTPDLSDLLASGREVLDNLNRTARLLRSVLSDEEVIGGVKKALETFSESAEAAAALANSITQLSNESRPEMLAALRRLHAAADQLQQTTAAVDRRLQQSTALDNLDATLRISRETAGKADKLVSDLSAMVADPKAQRDWRETLTNAHDAAAELKAVSGDLRAFSLELRKAAPAVPKVAAEAESIAAYSSDLRERLRPPEINARFDILHSGQAERTYSTGNLDIKTSEGHFVRLGIDDIGEEGGANVQLGEQQRKLTLRYGLVRSRLGFGLDIPISRSSVSLDIFDPNNVRADILADVPWAVGRADLGLLAGVRDLGDSGLYVAGLRLRR
jgi:phospholipid/cholesterol/gamma-HCH transport system substrate-binding protein